jgi:2-C-methyl-D-erythritol 4-phosphate cytidylyltransferase/2-C-methyl-D-erythritol 2,4-cyclodiphosphate synthase
MSVAAIIVAAGRGSRAGEGLPKQYRPVGGRSILARTLNTFLAHGAVDRVLAVIHPDDRPLYAQASAALGPSDRLLAPAEGAATRQGSVLAGLEALARDPPEIVLVHDAARPFVTAGLVERAVAAARAFGAAVPGVPVTDTVKVVGPAGEVVGTLHRGTLRAVQTPQAFRYDLLADAHRRAAAAGVANLTDDGSVAEWAGHPVAVFEGEDSNLKLTNAADLAAAERRIRELSLEPSAVLVTRVGTGFDVHAFTAGDHLWLGGLRVAHGRGVEAHSDGDVILHALTDALLGALADGDIGVHFPAGDPRWRGASSDRFLADAAGRVRARGGRIDHLDVTLLCESPRLGPLREAMRARIAAIAGIQADQISVKATTTERLGFTGRGEGLAAHAAATIRLPEGRR